MSRSHYFTIVISTFVAMFAPTRIFSWPENPLYTLEHARESARLLKEVISKYPPKDHILVFSGPLAAVHALTARLLLPSWWQEDGYFLTHPLVGYHVADENVKEAYWKSILALSDRRNKKIIILRQLDSGGVMTRMVGDIQRLNINDVGRKIILAAVSSEYTKRNVIRSTRANAKADPSQILDLDYFRSDILDHYSNLALYFDLDHPAQMLPERMISYAYWYEKNQKIILPQRQGNHKPLINPKELFDHEFIMMHGSFFSTCQELSGFLDTKTKASARF